jgi:diadenosine tetraphosphate (Ap4A) HIT family hydrolase
MCAGLGAAESIHGIRVWDGTWAEANLARRPMRPGYTVVIWKGRHVAEPWELSTEEAAGFWFEVSLVALAVEEQYRPVKMNWLSLGNGVPHLHVHLVPRPLEDPRAGGPLEGDAFDAAATPELPQAQLEAEAAAVRARLERRIRR